MSVAKSRELAVLAVLSAHDAHGYAIAQVFDGGALALLGLSRASVYAIVQRFRSRGWIEGNVESSGNYPDKEVLTLTAAGRTAYYKILGEKTSNIPPSTTPILALTMAVDAGETIPKSIIEHLLNARLNMRYEIDTDVHANTLSAQLSRSILHAEIEALRSALQKISTKA